MKHVLIILALILAYFYAGYLKSKPEFKEVKEVVDTLKNENFKRKSI